MTPAQIEASKEELKHLIFKAAASKDKVSMFKAFKQKYTTIDVYAKPDPSSSTGSTKVRRKVIRYYFDNIGTITDMMGRSVVDVIVEQDEILFAVHVLQEDQFNVLAAHPFDDQKRYFNVKITPETFLKLVIAAFHDIPAQDAQKRGFIRRLAYGQHPLPEVDEFIKEHIPDLYTDLSNFREKHGGRQIPSDDDLDAAEDSDAV